MVIFLLYMKPTTNNFKDLSGRRYGLLKVIKFDSINKWGRSDYLCSCDCGQQKVVSGNNLNAGKTKSCGCQSSKNTLGARRLTHGLSGQRFNNIYRTMRARCKKPSSVMYARYGGVGVKCIWNNFTEFMEDMYEPYLQHVKEFGEKNTTIDRINPFGNYCKENCRWATLKEQANNKRSKYVHSL